jgi:cation transport protein ChaC
VFIATADNVAYLGESSEFDFAQQIFHATGPSGTNRDYLIKLADSLSKMGVEDRHVFEIDRHLEILIKTQARRT